MKADNAHDAKSLSLIHRYFHPLLLQQLSPERFARTVDKILSGKLKLLIGRLDQNQETE